MIVCGQFVRARGICRAKSSLAISRSKTSQESMQSTPNTVPSSISSSILEFCRSIAPTEPVFITSVPLRRSATSFCFENVDRKIAKSGGSKLFGWAIWHIPDLYFEAEHHAVWRNKNGGLIDVSPQMGQRRRMLFLPDPSAVYDPMCPHPNILAPDGASPKALEFVQLGQQRNALLMQCRILGTAEIRLFAADQIELALIDRRIQELLTV